MRVNADYLAKSRHGIWYYRWVVPDRLRALHPGLPKELSTCTVTVSEAFDKYAALQVSLGTWSKQTLVHTHEPSIRLFRELVGRPTQRVTETQVRRHD